MKGEAAKPEPELNMICLGERLRSARTAKKQSRSKCAERCEISERYLTDIERGLKAPKLGTFVRIANAVGVSAEYLLQDSLTAPDEAELLKSALNRLSPKQKKMLQSFLVQFLETLD